jgi:lipopolysaccharide heptosyltransferase II
LTILLVRPRLIGDVILTTPIVRAVRRRFPDAHLLYAVEAPAAPVLESNPHLSELIVIRHRAGWRRIAEDALLAARLRARRVDVAVDLHGGARSGWLVWATRAPVRVGYDVSGRQWHYTHRIPRPRGYAPRHSVRNLWDLIAAWDPALGGGPDPDADPVEMPIADDARARAGEKLAAIGIRSDDELIVVHGAAGNDFRRWPEASFAAVAAELARDEGRRVIVLGGPADAAVVGAIVTRARRESGSGTGRIDAAIDWPLAEVRALMERAALFIGGDSGPMHVAATTDVPIVAIFGPTTPETWAPWRPSRVPSICVEPGALACRPCDQRACEPGDFRCLRSTEPERVIAAARRLLERAA